jgi:hypothetical protein
VQLDRWGGRLYTFADGATQVGFPHNFRPELAPASQLYRYGIDPRPAGGRAVKVWLKEWAGVTNSPPGPPIECRRDRRNGGGA